jgi:3-oxoacyl-[acyl-carrier-protein] synthase II
LSLGESMRVIERGAADACLTGGAEFKLNPMALLRQHFAKRLAEAMGDDEDPSSVVKPFDAAARGSVLGEGGGILVVEAEEVAKARGAKPYCTVAGFASSQSFCRDAEGLDPDSDDEALRAAIENALADAGVKADAIDAIVPLGSSLPGSDAAEAAAIRAAFGPRSESIPLVTVVPIVGNCCAGAGAIALSVAAKMLKEQRVIRGSSLVARGDGPSAVMLSAVANEQRTTNPLRNILVMTTSMGGQNAAVVLCR